MKITHVSLCGPVTDNFSYQDNLLPKYHKKIGFDVSMITSKYIWDKGNISIDNRDIYLNEYGIKTIRLENKKKTTIHSKFKRYHNLYETLSNEKPDILFVHGVQFLDIKKIVDYVKENIEVKVYVDNHADFSNSATNFLSKNILHKILWRRCAQLIEPYTTKFYGVLPARVDFLQNVYDIPEEKTELLVMGTDDDKVNSANNLLNKSDLRKKYNINQDDFLIMTGGKIDNAKKQTLLLMEAINHIPNEKVKLIVFGSVIPELKEEVKKLINGSRIQYAGWIESEESYQYFAAADLVVFPGRHSVFWEQVVGQGIPMVVKWWEGTTHVDLGGNVKFLYDDSIEEIMEILTIITSDDQLYSSMNKVAKKNNSQFLYSNIAKKSLDMN